MATVARYAERIEIPTIPLGEKLKSVLHFFGVRTGEVPSYTVLAREGAREVRTYGSLVVATATGEGSRRESQKNTFRYLADYLFGDNESGTCMEMTTPVLECGSQLSFILPSRFTVKNAPLPVHDEVELKEIPARTVAVLTFSGWATEGKIRRKAIQLLDWVGTCGTFETAAPVQCAQYDPPATIPFFRRNEVWVEIRELES